MLFLPAAATISLSLRICINPHLCARYPPAAAFLRSFVAVSVSSSFAHSPRTTPCGIFFPRHNANGMDGVRHRPRRGQLATQVQLPGVLLHTYAAHATTPIQPHPHRAPSPSLLPSLIISVMFPFLPSSPLYSHPLCSLPTPSRSVLFFLHLHFRYIPIRYLLIFTSSRSVLF
ncbi:hypothetical protein C8R43DRAFT_620136 [Mycena crocata]|nr:hypothetical protein C8R43DRAFT_620136 [Mycena crocata]